MADNDEISNEHLAAGFSPMDMEDRGVNEVDVTAPTNSDGFQDDITVCPYTLN